MKSVLACLAVFASLLTATPAVAQSDDLKAKLAACGACHGPDGNSASPDYPILAGQTARYLYLQLRDFKEGRRKNPFMSALAANLSKQDMRDLADFYAAQKQKPTGFKADPAKVARGKKVADDALCPMCHLGGFSGQNEIPRVAGQHQAYVLKQLNDFRNKERTNDAGNMTSVLKGISVEDLEALSHYIADIN